MTAPRRFAVVRGIDPEHVHAGRDQVTNRLPVARGLGLRRHHDAHRAALSGSTEQLARVLREQALASSEHVRRVGSRPPVTAQRLQRPQNRVERRHDVSLRPAERGQSERGQPVLDVAQVMASQRYVVDQVASAVTPRRRRLRDQPFHFLLGGKKRSAYAVELLLQPR